MEKRKRSRQECTLETLLLNMVLEVPAREIRQKKAIKCFCFFHIGKKEAKLSLFVKDIIFIYGKIKRLHNKLLELINSIMLENEKSIPKICYVFMQ